MKLRHFSRVIMRPMWPHPTFTASGLRWSGQPRRIDVRVREEFLLKFERSGERP